MFMQTKIFAFAGKGGVGKTSLSAAFIRVLSESFPDKKILAVDADPAVGLATALQMQPALTLDDIRVQIAENIEQGKTTEAIELLSEAKFHLMDAIVEKDNISFLAIGRPEAAGCYCKVNAYLKQVIEMLCENYDFVVIDGEAGIEQINRRVMENITYLVLVSDGSKKGIQVISTIKEVADKLITCKKCGVIFNRIRSSFDAESVLGIPRVLSVIGEDENQSENDMQGESVFNLDAESVLYQGAKKALFSLLEEN
ncbi:MAG: cobyrinic acid a,c-diamide synthase [Ruminococcaceae bacterium]|nr:cobyrinic acid a,c-diamide synthase [Oscillospiraceae bacterium]